MSNESQTINTLLEESRTYEPSAEFRAQANVNDPEIYARAAADPVAFWEDQARQLAWIQPWTQALDDSKAPFYRWFVGGKLNACYNCVDRHVESGHGDKPAIVCEFEPGDHRIYSYSETLVEVCKIANALKALGVQKGDRVCLYMPMTAELCFTMLACARIGAAHSVVFGGFSPDSIAERVNDAEVKVIVTADGGWRRGKVIELKRIVDEAIGLGCPTIEKVLVLERMGSSAQYNKGVWHEDRDVSWSELVGAQSESCPCEPMDSEDLLFILYTSGSTGKPKGIMHSTGGYLTGVSATSRWVFDLKPHDIYWCTADCGWVTGHSYIVYGPMAEAATVLVYEGSPDFPDKDRFWRIIERHRVTILYTAPTAIRTFMKWGTNYPEQCDLSSLRLLGSVGEPINPEAWVWYHKFIGRRNCPIVDTWWQTETGNIMISPLPGLTTTKPGSATRPLPGLSAAIMSEEGKVLAEVSGHIEKPDQAIGGILALTKPWPGMLRGIWGDPERYANTYWSRFEGKYFPGDGIKLDEDGFLFLLGRVDDIMLVAGHNISTMEVESALVDHPAVAEAAVIGKTHEIKGQGICAFVTIKSDVPVTSTLIDDLKKHVGHKIGPIARPDDIILTAELPKTRSGKIMRRLLRDIAEGRELGDTTTLGDPNVVAALRDKYENQEG